MRTGLYGLPPAPKPVLLQLWKEDDALQRVVRCHASTTTVILF